MFDAAAVCMLLFFQESTFYFFDFYRFPRVFSSVKHSILYSFSVQCSTEPTCNDKMVICLRMDIDVLCECRELFEYIKQDGNRFLCRDAAVTTVHVPMIFRARTTAQIESTYTCTNEPVWARTAV